MTAWTRKFWKYQTKYFVTFIKKNLLFQSKIIYRVSMVNDYADTCPRSQRLIQHVSVQSTTMPTSCRGSQQLHGHWTDVFFANFCENSLKKRLSVPGFWFVKQSRKSEKIIHCKTVFCLFYIACSTHYTLPSFKVLYETLITYGKVCRPLHTQQKNDDICYSLYIHILPLAIR